MSQQETSAKPSRPASLEIDEHEGNDIQVDDEGMGHNEEREATERTEMAERCNEASKAMESSMRRKMHEKGKNPSLKRYMTCDIALQVLCVSHDGSHLDSPRSHSLLQTTSKKAMSLACVCKPSSTPYLRCSPLGTQPP